MLFESLKFEDRLITFYRFLLQFLIKSGWHSVIFTFYSFYVRQQVLL